MTTSACGGSACIAGVSRDCGHGIFRLERRASCSQSRRATSCATPGYFVILSGWSYSPKPGAIPTSLYPDIHFSAIISRREEKSKFFLSVVIPVVKTTFMPFSATGGKPAIARTARLCGLLSKPRMDRVYAHPNQARYQLRYTRIWNDLMGMDPPEATRRRALHTIPVHYNTPAAKREAYSYPFFFAGSVFLCGENSRLTLSKMRI